VEGNQRGWPGNQGGLKMSGWLKVIGALAVCLTPVIAWMLSPGQRAKRRRKREQKELKRFEEMANSGDADGMRDDIMGHR